MRKKVFYLLLILVAFFVFNIKCYAVDDPSKFYLYGFGDDYDDDDYLTVHNTRRCYVNINNIPISEADNIKLTVEDESIAEVRFIIRGSNSNPVITADIEGKKLGTTAVIASLTYNGVNYTSKIITTVHQSNYRIDLLREDNKNLEGTTLKKGETLKLNALLIRGMSSHMGNVSATWSSSNSSVLSVKDGLITANKAGTATITAKYVTDEGETISDSAIIEVKDVNETPSIRFLIEDPGPVMILGFNDKYSVGFENIPTSERKNISFKIDDERIAKIKNVEYGIDAKVNIEYLSTGKTKLTATINYNGKTYYDVYDIEVKEAKIKFYYDEPGPSMKLGYEEKYSVELENLPVFMNDEIKFKVENEKIAKVIKVDYNSNYVDAVATVKYLSAGTTKLIATITCGSKTYTATYDITVKNPGANNSGDSNLDKNEIVNNDTEAGNSENNNPGADNSEVDNSEINNYEVDNKEVRDTEKDKSNIDNSKDSHTNNGLLVAFSGIVGVVILVIVAIIIKKKKASSV